MDVDLPAFELGWPGPMRNRLVAAVLSGAKTATCSLRATYDLEGEPLPQAGERQALVSSAGERLAVVEIVDVRELRLVEVNDDVAYAEGEGFADAEEWRRAHEAFWTEELATVPGGENVTVDDQALVVVETFRVVRD